MYHRSETEEKRGKEKPLEHIESGRSYMKYAIIGAGGCGGSIGAFLARAGQDVTLIARGAHLTAIKEHGICVESPSQTFTVTDIKVVDEAGYAEIPDVLFVCVKGYSIPDIIPFLREHSDAETLIVPILNIYGTGAKLQQALPDATVVDGCIYIAAEIKEPGVILQKGDIFRIVFGARKGQALCRKMFLLEQELKAAGIDAVLSDQIERDAFQKYAYVSPMAACGLYYDATAEVFQRAGEERMLLIRCMKEIDALATAMGIPFLVDIEKTNLDILDALVPEASTSMQRDIWAGKPSEIDGLLYEPLRLGQQYGVEMPNYEMIVKVLKEKYGE